MYNASIKRLLVSWKSINGVHCVNRINLFILSFELICNMYLSNRLDIYKVKKPLNRRWYYGWIEFIVNMHLFHRIDIVVIYGIFIHKLSGSNAQSWIAKSDILPALFFFTSFYLTTSSDISALCWRSDL